MLCVVERLRSCFKILVASGLLATPSEALALEVTFEAPLDGLTRVEAVIRLEALGFDYDVRAVDVCGRPDSVVGTIPPIEAGTVLSSDEIITLKIATNSGEGAIPRVVGMTLEGATKILNEHCFEVKDVVLKHGNRRFGRCGTGLNVFDSDGGVSNRIHSIVPQEGAMAPLTSSVTVTRFESGRWRVAIADTWPENKECQ